MTVNAEKYFIYIFRFYFWRLESIRPCLCVMVIKGPLSKFHACLKGGLTLPRHSLNILETTFAIFRADPFGRGAKHENDKTIFPENKLIYRKVIFV